jgi:enamine deaminase RidA (YjgF/YER057c/UK114 family)
VGDRVLVSGTTATDTKGNVVCPGDVEGQTVYILDKIAASLEAAGATMDDVVRTRIYLTDPERWEDASRAHARALAGAMPANTLIAAAALIGPYAVEIEAEAVVGGAAG